MRGLVLMLLLGLAGCTPMLAPRGIAERAPAIAGDVFIARDGVRLPLRHWDAAHPRAIIVALHGMSDYSHAFAMPAPVWAEAGITTYAYDQRGFGAAPDAGLWAGSEILRRDFADCVAAVRARHPGMPVFALGESMGGAVILSALATGDAPHLAGVILAAPAVWSRADMPLSYRVTLWVMAHTLPWMKLSGEGLKIWPSDNIDMLRAQARDPLVQKTARVDQIWGLVNLMDQARAAASHLDDPPPILLLYGARDQIVPAASTRAVIAALGAKAQVRRYPFGYHMLLRDLDGPMVWKDIADWIGAREKPPVTIPPSSSAPRGSAEAGR